MPGCSAGVGYLSRTTVDRFIQAKECVAELATVAKGDVCSGASTTA